MRKLFLASTAKDSKTIKDIEEFVGGFVGKKIAYIPTAVNGDKPWYDWRTGGSAKLVLTLGADIEFLELEKEEDKNIYKSVEKADIIWVAGGMTGYLMYWFNRTKLNRVIPELVVKGKLYVGSSAGIWVCQEKFTVAEWYIGEPEPGAQIFKGMGFVSFETYPHYEDHLLSEIKKRWSGGDLYLLKTGEAITVVGDEIKVIGEKRILRNGELI